MIDISTLLDGVARHYREEAALTYFRYQRIGGPLKGELNRRKFDSHIAPCDHVLDFGCGPGFTLAALQTGAGKVGVDPNEHNRRSAAELGVRAVATTQELEEATVDVAISNHALEHTLSPYAELLGLRRVLRPWGRLALCVPINDWRSERQPRLDDPNHHLYTWTPLLLGNLLQEAGFLVRSCEVVHYGTPGRLTYPLARFLPRSAFDLVCRATAFLLRRREIRAVAVRSTDRIAEGNVPAAAPWAASAPGSVD